MTAVIMIGASIMKKLMDISYSGKFSKKKDTPAEVFSCEFSKIFKNTFFTEYLRTTASQTGKQLMNTVTNLKLEP